MNIKMSLTGWFEPKSFVRSVMPLGHVFNDGFGTPTECVTVSTGLL